MFNSEKLRQLRKEAGLTQADVATKLNIKRETYTRYETGTINPPSDMILSMAKIFEVSTDYLLGSSDDPTPPNKKDSSESEESPEVKEMFEKIKKFSQKNLDRVIDYIDYLENSQKK